MLTLRRQKLFYNEYQEFNKIYRGKGTYADIMTSIENSIEKDIIFFNNTNRQTDFNFIELKDKVKKVEHQIKINNIMKASKLRR